MCQLFLHVFLYSWSCGVVDESSLGGCGLTNAKGWSRLHVSLLPGLTEKEQWARSTTDEGGLVWAEAGGDCDRDLGRKRRMSPVTG